LIAELLLQRTPWWKVQPAWSRLIAAYPEPAALAGAIESDVLVIIKPLGLPRRAKTLVQLAQALEVRHLGRVPAGRSELIKLPGVGDYIAAAVQCVAYGKAVPMLDSVTARVYKRYFGLPGKADVPDASVVRTAARALPRDPSIARQFNLALIDLAGQICKPARPRCEICPLATRCRSAGRTYDRGTWRNAAANVNS
jgi:A/G-specific adenine glycosylase